MTIEHSYINTHTRMHTYTHTIQQVQDENISKDENMRAC